MHSRSRRPIGAVALLALLWLAGCGHSPNAPGIQPQVVNNPDNFAYQTSNVRFFTGSATYTWQNSGTSASVNQATTVTSGSITVTIKDAVGTQVYTRSLADNGTFATTAGTAGAWSIRVDYSAASGTVNFRVQKL